MSTNQNPSLKDRIDQLAQGLPFGLEEVNAHVLSLIAKGLSQDEAINQAKSYFESRAVTL